MGGGMPYIYRMTRDIIDHIIGLKIDIVRLIVYLTLITITRDRYWVAMVRLPQLSFKLDIGGTEQKISDISGHLVSFELFDTFITDTSKDTRLLTAIHGVMKNSSLFMSELQTIGSTILDIEDKLYSVHVTYIKSRFHIEGQDQIGIGNMVSIIIVDTPLEIIVHFQFNSIISLKQQHSFINTFEHLLQAYIHIPCTTTANVSSTAQHPIWINQSR